MSERPRVLLHYDRPEAFDDLIRDRFPDVVLYCCHSYARLAAVLEEFRPQILNCSSVFEGWERRTAEMFCDNLQRWIDGQPLDNAVDPARGY